MNLRAIMILVVIGLVFGLNAFAQEKPSPFYPKVFWENSMDKGAILVRPNEIVLVDSNGLKYGKVLAKDEVDSAYMSPDGKKLIYTAASGVWLVKIESGEIQLVAKGYCDYLRWNADGLSFLFTISEYKKEDVPSVLNIKLFWADGDGKNIKQVYP